jgi:tetratricopeptide (TPR) repeat protein
VGEEAIKVAGSVLEKRPAHMNALRARALLSSGLAGDALENSLRARRGLELAEAAIRDWEDFLKLDPGNTIAWNNLAVSRGWSSRALGGLGRYDEGMERLRSTKDLEKRAGAGDSPYLAGAIAFHYGWLAALEAELGRRAEAMAVLAEHHRYAEKASARLVPDSFLRRNGVEFSARMEVLVAEGLGDHAAMRDKAAAAVERLRVFKTANRGQQRARDALLAYQLTYLGTAHYRLGNPAAAEVAFLDALKDRDVEGRLTMETQLDRADRQVWLAMSLARQGRAAEARAAVEPALALHRYLRSSGSEDVGQHEALARALYAAALADPPRAGPLLGEATRVLDGMPKEMTRRTNHKELRAWIAAGVRGRG